ncbi:MAG: type II toxin-antitoxin system VapC family toxin [bacterium]|nr:type II toxin-antitoxin system VapC family toxin [bacterium]
MRATTGLKTPDALHGATALGAGTDLFITNDPHFLRIPGGG